MLSPQPAWHTLIKKDPPGRCAHAALARARSISLASSSTAIAGPKPKHWMPFARVNDMSVAPVPIVGMVGLSPDDRPGEVLTNVWEWLEVGVRLVWVIDPDRGVAAVYRDDGSVTTVSSDADVDGEAVLPGFSFRLSELFD